VNARDLSQRKMETLQSYVRDLGGGLVVVGGPESFGMGGYYKTPLEEALPVDMQIKDQERFPLRQHRHRHRPFRQHGHAGRRRHQNSVGGGRGGARGGTAQRF
jgi:hypothetical protein